MGTENYHVDRRTVLKGMGTAALSASLAGCSQLGILSEKNDDVVLQPPENYDLLADVDLPYPYYGEKLPEARIPAPLHERTVTTTEFVDDRHTMLTFIFTSCTTVCSELTAALRRVQADSIEREYADEMAFMPITFDPAYDTAEVLRDYGTRLGVDFEVGNWYFLRPETPADAKDIVEEQFGVAYERDDQAADASDDHDDSEDHEDGEMEGHDHERNFVHSSLILLVNRAGFVERAYNGGVPTPSTLLEDVRTVVEGW